MTKFCQEDGCKISAVFGNKGEKPMYCSEHKYFGMINLKSKRCESDACDLIAVYGIKGGKIQFCKKHSKEGMIDIKSRICDEETCKMRGIFGIKIIGQNTKLTYCGKHKKDGMVNLTRKQCEHDGCISIASYGQKRGIEKFCLVHKEKDMVFINLNYCEYSGCESIPSFGEKGGKRRFCVKHKLEGMIDIKNKRCEHEGCNSITPVFGNKGEKPRFCKEHKLKGMIDVKNKRCEYDGCESLSSCFDIKGGSGRFCAKHKTADMVDVKSISCDNIACRYAASYGKPGIKESKCSKHRLPGMIRRSKSSCKTKGCSEIAVWGSNWIPKHCETHKLNDEQNLIENPCASCGLLYILDKSNTCENCNPISFATARLAKQNALMDFLDARGLKGDSTDTMIENGLCGKERPDRVYDFGDKIIILECDEHQHRDRACSCEQSRMVNLGQAYGGTPVYFIRWNPDDYIAESRKKEPDAIEKRHMAVYTLLRDIKRNKVKLPLALVSVFYMYYDEWSSIADETWKVILPFHGITSAL